MSQKLIGNIEKHPELGWIQIVGTQTKRGITKRIIRRIKSPCDICFDLECKNSTIKKFKKENCYKSDDYEKAIC